MSRPQITPQMQRAMDKHGGTIPMKIKSDGETIFDNSDATAMAIQSIKRGGPAANNGLSVNKIVENWITDNLMEHFTCNSCNMTYNMFLGSIYVGEKPNQYYEENIVRCPYCFNDNKVKELPESRKEEIKKMMDIYEEYSNFKTNLEKEEFILKKIKENIV